MLKVIGDLIKDNVNIDDKVISESMMTAAKDGAIYSAAIGQMVEGHTALTALAVKKEWLKPYESPVNMLSCAYNCASNTAANKD